MVIHPPLSYFSFLFIFPPLFHFSDSLLLSLYIHVYTVYRSISIRSLIVCFDPSRRIGGKPRGEPISTPSLIELISETELQICATEFYFISSPSFPRAVYTVTPWYFRSRFRPRGIDRSVEWGRGDDLRFSFFFFLEIFLEIKSLLVPRVFRDSERRGSEVIEYSALEGCEGTLIILDPRMFTLRDAASIFERQGGRISYACVRVRSLFLSAFRQVWYRFHGSKEGIDFVY